MFDVRCSSPSSILQKSRPAQCGEVILFHAGKSLVRDGRARDQHQIHRTGQFILMKPERLSHQSPRSIANNRIADLATGDDAQARYRTRWQRQPVRDEAAQNQTLPLLPRARKIAAQLDVHRWDELQALGRRSGHCADRLNRRQAFAAHAAAIGQSGLAALGAATIEETVLPFAANLGRLILSFHKIKKCCL